jgi:hypothetical protein
MLVYKDITHNMNFEIHGITLPLFEDFSGMWLPVPWQLMDMVVEELVNHNSQVERLQKRKLKK